ncbi:ABC transporter substrate-binding protein [Breznakiella homolactica]|uniref:ABC transporter substrate-binding protein n=1 Tax=Breznakiella homolactica TaxID=2798577 RepID=A0A7T7XKQ0_9SPIR|nr:ABC transporter substrate-binding protein [Breznakiella homolactica]QQO07987.1 ABC transporter substrate-binding protein [Breznakiella homolactica]
MKRLTFLIVLLSVFAGFAAAQSHLTIYGIKGPSAVGMIRVFDRPPRIPGMTVTVEALASADLMAAKFISGEAKIGILPPNVAAKIASAGKPVQVAAVVGTGMLSLLTADPSVQSVEDFKGKTVEVAGQGATPDYVFRRILISRGMNPDRDLRLGYSLAYPEIAQSLIAGRVENALLPEPFATMARSGKPNLRVVGDIQEEWVRAGGEGNYPMTVLVVDANFAREQPGVLRAILNEYKNSIEWVTANPAEAGALVEKHNLGLKAPVVAMAVPRSNYVFIPAAAARPALESLYRTFLEFSSASIGGVLPGDGFYYR